MNVALRRPMTVESFLDWEERQELRFEFDGFRPVAMTGGTAAHDLIQQNVIVALRARLKAPCRTFGSNLKVMVAGSVRYPDAGVACVPIEPKSTVEREPIVLFEVLSHSSGHTDTIVKNSEYRDTPPILRYIILEQDAIGATVFVRTGDDWVGRPFGLGSVLDMPEVGVQVPIEAFYEGLDFTPREQDEAVV